MPPPAPAPAPQTGSARHTRTHLHTGADSSQRCRPRGKSPSTALLTDCTLPRFHLDSGSGLKLVFLSFFLANSQGRHIEQKDAGSSANEKDAPRAGLNSYLDSLFSQLMVRLSELYVLFTMFLNSFNLS